MVILIYLIFLILCSIFVHRRIINLPVLFLGIWSFIILLYSLKLSYHQSDLTINTIIYLSIIFTAYFIGYFYFFTFYLRYYKNKELFDKSLKSEKNTLSIDLNTRFIELSFWIIILLIVFEGIYSKGFPLFWSILGIPKSYFDFGIPTLHGILMSFILFFGTLLYISLKVNYKKRHLIYFIIIVLIMVLLITRQNIVILFIQVFLVQHFLIKKINLFRLIPIGILGIVIFGFIGNFRTGLDNFIDVAALKNKDISQLESGFYWVYMYLTMTLANLNKLFSIDFSHTEGLYMLQSFLPTVILEYFYNLDLGHRFWLVHHNFTVSGYIASPYLDFGLIGVFIYTFFLGILSCSIYHRYLFSKNLQNGFLYIILLLIIMMSFFTDYLLYLPVSFQFFWTILFLRRNKLEVKSG